MNWLDYKYYWFWRHWNGSHVKLGYTTVIICLQLSERGNVGLTDAFINLPSRIDCCKYSFFPWTIVDWNPLPSLIR